MILPTVRIKTKSKGGFLVINESDFNEKIHKLFEDVEEDSVATEDNTPVSKSKTPETKPKAKDPFA